MERSIKKRGVHPTASEMEAVPISLLESGIEKDNVKRKVVDGRALHKKERKTLLEQHVVDGAQRY